MTFDKEAQEALPEHVKAKMKADRERSRLGHTQRECVNCKKLSWINPADKEDIVLGLCEHCNHPIWEDKP